MKADVGMRLHPKSAGALWGQWCLCAFFHQPFPAASLNNFPLQKLSKFPGAQACWIWSKSSNSSLNLSCLSQVASPQWKILQGQRRQNKVWVSQSKTERLFLSSRYSLTSQAKLTSWLFQLSCWKRDLCQLSALLNLGQQDTKPKSQTVLWQTLLSSSTYTNGLLHFI